MKHLALIDTGPIVAALNRRDQHHAWTLEAMATCGPRLLTCEAVLSEAFFLLQQVPGAHDKLLLLLARELILPDFSLASECSAVNRLMRKFADVPMSFANACMLRMSELRPEARILTLDQDFLTYRKHGRHEVPLIAPFKSPPAPATKRHKKT